jgi:type II secretory pathway component PulC
VVSTLNGTPLTAPDRALEAYSTLKDAKRVEVAVIRGGKPLTLVVQVR